MSLKTLSRKTLVPFACGSVLLLGLAGCTPPDHRSFDRTATGAAVGAASGAAIGAVSGENVLEGAGRGAAGGAAGGFIFDQIQKLKGR